MEYERFPENPFLYRIAELFRLPRFTNPPPYSEEGRRERSDLLKKARTSVMLAIPSHRESIIDEEFVSALREAATRCAVKVLISGDKDSWASMAKKLDPNVGPDGYSELFGGMRYL